MPVTAKSLKRWSGGGIVAAGHLCPQQNCFRMGHSTIDVIANYRMAYQLSRHKLACIVNLYGIQEAIRQMLYELGVYLVSTGVFNRFFGGGC